MKTLCKEAKLIIEVAGMNIVPALLEPEPMRMLVPDE